ncbi:protein RBL-like [Vicia villosa]|uniref:protein RBL-like n=1 Tax=Vicia villosa TaxID=3911 RepID=UPI00273CE3FB|nr:protein RBL-like [Vicia villosa]
MKGFPEVIEEFLEHEPTMKCVAFNRRGTLLAAGCNDGSCVIWDFETRGIAKELRDEECSSPITSVCWSRSGNRILVSAVDKSLTMWDVMSGTRITRIFLIQTPLQVSFCPGSSNSSLCLVCPVSCTPMIVDLNNGNTTLLKISVLEKSNGLNPAASRNKGPGGTPVTPAAACFNKTGNLVYVGNSKGKILVIDGKDGEVRAMVRVSDSIVKNVVFSRNGRYLLTNSYERIIRIYENLLPLKNEIRALDELDENQKDLDGIEKLNAVGSKCLTLVREFKDSVRKVHLKAPCFSANGEWVVGGSANKSEHKIYIWNRDGQLARILKGPKESLLDLAWHPVRPVIVSVSVTGVVYIWAKHYTEYWSALYPDFTEIDKNEVLVEEEDEFDLNPRPKVNVSDVDEDEEVDILTVEKDTTFSDSDMSQEELCYLPVTPIPDPPELLLIQEQVQEPQVPEPQIMLLEYYSNPVDNNNSGSFIPESAEPNVELMNQALTLYIDDGEGTRGKRMRKPSQKMLELQEQQAKKASKSKKKLLNEENNDDANANADAEGTHIKRGRKPSKKDKDL